MNWQIESILLPLTAAGAATSFLIILHQLRVQPPKRIVATTLFWKQAVHEENRRVLWGKLSRWKSFAFLLVILLLLALALSGLHTRSLDQSPDVVMVIDTGSSMAVTDSTGQTRLSEAIKLANHDISQVHGQKVVVIQADEHPRLLSKVDDPISLAEAAIQEIKINSPYSGSTGALEMALALVKDSGKVNWYTDRDGIPSDLPKTVLPSIQIRRVGHSTSNAGIMSAVFKPSGPLALAGDLHIRVGKWSDDRPKLTVQLAIPSRTTINATQIDINDEVIFRDVLADGSEATLTLLPMDALTMDNVVKLKLPIRNSIRFQCDDGIPASLRTASDILSQPLATNSIRVIDGYHELDNSSIQILHGKQIGMAGSTIVSTMISIDLEAAVCGDGTDLRSIVPDIRPLLKAGDYVLAGIRGKNLLLSDALFSNKATCVQKPAFLSLLVKSSQELSGWTENPVSIQLERVQSDPLWTTSQSTVVYASDEISDLRVPVTVESPTATHQTASLSYAIWQWVLAGAITLLLFEMWLNLRGKVV